ncbi:ABC transporter substrate-binding protein [Paraburkholderia sp. BCC1886]|uniref:ABC transporter substrate-binding protein n=1 Tax=Paraburkholderia sp. BCC1886 TaxID=2562670 RepID=UPI001183E83B|nr:ABC transporter substrate-binding protein [Paraburkholderia sp. BCC1886]
MNRVFSVARSTLRQPADVQRSAPSRWLRSCALSLPLAFALIASGPAFAQVKIGSILSVTGPAAFLGEDMKDAMQMAVDDLNAHGGINGQKVEWVFYDGESQPAKAINATRRLISQDKVSVIVGGGNMSGIALAMQPLAEKAQVPFVSTEGAMSIVYPAAQRKFAVKSTVDDDQVLERLADYFDKQKITKIAFLADSSGFGQSAVEQLKTIAKERKLEVVYQSFNPSDTDLTPQLTAAKSASVGAVVCWTVTPAGLIFIKQAKQLGLTMPLIHSYGFVDQRYMKLAGEDAKSILLVSVKFPVGADLPDNDPVKSNILDLTKRFEARFGHAPNQFVAQSYDAVMLAAQAMQKAGPKADGAAIAGAFAGIQGYKGISGIYTFSPERHSGLSKSDTVMIRYDGTRFRLADYH